MVWRAEDPQGNEAGKIRWEIVEHTRGKVLDIGCGGFKAFPHFIGVDNGTDIRLFGHQFRPDLWIEDAKDLRLFASGQFDAVFSSHLLEHIEPKHLVKTLTEWMRVLKVGGKLVLYLPDETLYPKVGEKGANPDHKWNVSYTRLIEIMQAGPLRGWDLIDWQRRDEGQEYSLYTVFQKLEESSTQCLFSCVERERAWKESGPHVCVVRYGAYGDLIQTSSVLAALKREGYHVTLMTAPPGDECIKHDPNIDRFYLQDKDQVPNHELGAYWNYHRKKYDKWVQLSESVERTFLALPGTTVHQWAPAARHRVLNVNYVEMQHAIADVPYRCEMKFYPTDEERKWAAAERKAIKGDFCVVYALNGSSVNKRWPWMDQLIARALLDFPDLHFVLVGALDGQILEQGWFAWDKDPNKHEDAKKIQTEPRVHLRAARWEMRQTLAFLDQADLVFGPETGVLNAAAMMPMPKVVLLSHSSVENLCRDWVNTHALASADTECPGRGKNEAPACHQMHYGFEFCRQALYPKGTGPDPQDPKKILDGEGMGVAQCQVDLSLDDVYKVFWHAVTWAKEGRTLEQIVAEQQSRAPPTPLHLVADTGLVATGS